MALSTADLAALYSKGDKYVTVDANGVLLFGFADFGSAVKSGGTAGCSVAILNSDGTYTLRANSVAGTHDFGVKR